MQPFFTLAGSLYADCSQSNASAPFVMDIDSRVIRLVLQVCVEGDASSAGVSSRSAWGQQLAHDVGALAVSFAC